MGCTISHSKLQSSTARLAQRNRETDFLMMTFWQFIAKITKDYPRVSTKLYTLLKTSNCIQLGIFARHLKEVSPTTSPRPCTKQRRRGTKLSWTSFFQVYSFDCKVARRLSFDASKALWAHTRRALSILSTTLHIIAGNSFATFKKRCRSTQVLWDFWAFFVRSAITRLRSGLIQSGKEFVWCSGQLSRFSEAILATRIERRSWRGTQEGGENHPVSLWKIELVIRQGEQERKRETHTDCLLSNKSSHYVRGNRLLRLLGLSWLRHVRNRPTSGQTRIIFQDFFSVTGPNSLEIRIRINR